MRKMTDKKELMKLCSFIVMSCGRLKKTNNKNFHLEINGSQSSLEYYKSILENLTSVKIKDDLLYTKSLPFFSKLYKRLYHKGINTLDPHAFKLFDNECMYIMFLGCGSVDIINDKSTWKFNLNRYNIIEKKYFKDMVKKVFKIESNIKGDYLIFKSNLLFCTTIP